MPHLSGGFPSTVTRGARDLAIRGVVAGTKEKH